MTYISFIQSTLAEASQIALKKFGDVDVSLKAGDNNQVLTEADLAIGELIVNKIKAAYPNHNSIDEEAGVIDNGATTTWVVDPIDGTSNFASGLPTYGIMIGVLENDQPIAGGIALPAFDEIYLGGKNHPATKNSQAVTVSAETALSNCLVAYGIDGHQEDPSRTKDEARLLGKIILNIRNLRSTNSAYDMAKTVEGKYALYLNQTTKIWDNVAIQAIFEAAGGVCTDFYGEAIDYSGHLKKSDQNFTICAGPHELHEQIQMIIASQST